MEDMEDMLEILNNHEEEIKSYDYKSESGQYVMSEKMGEIDKWCDSYNRYPSYPTENPTKKSNNRREQKSKRDKYHLGCIKDLRKNKYYAQLYIGSNHGKDLGSIPENKREEYLKWYKLVQGTEYTPWVYAYSDMNHEDTSHRKLSNKRYRVATNQTTKRYKNVSYGDVFVMEDELRAVPHDYRTYGWLTW